MHLRRSLAALLLAGTGLLASTPLAVAAASDLRGTLEELAGAFRKEKPAVELKISYGSSGSLAAQIKQGAPFQVFLSADMGYPEQLIQAGCAQGSPLPYATGQLVLWVRKDLPPGPGGPGMKILLDPAVKRIALANPRLAPYGQAAEEALRGAGHFEAVKSRLVFGENVAQAAQYLMTGAADAGLVSLSMARQPALRDAGWIWNVPLDLHRPIHQGAVALVRSEEAIGFLAFLRGPEGQAILGRHGFGKP